MSIVHFEFKPRWLCEVIAKFLPYLPKPSSLYTTLRSSSRTLTVYRKTSEAGKEVAHQSRGKWSLVSLPGAPGTRRSLSPRLCAFLLLAILLPSVPFNFIAKSQGICKILSQFATALKVLLLRCGLSCYHHRPDSLFSGRGALILIPYLHFAQLKAAHDVPAQTKSI